MTRILGIALCLAGVGAPALATLSCMNTQGDGSIRRAINAADAPPPAGGYAQAVEVSGVRRILHVSGQIPVDRDGRVPADFASQCRLVWRHIEAQLRAADMSLDHLVKVTTYLSSRRHADENSAIRREVLGARAPALTVIIADIYDEAWLLEIDAVAAD